MRKTGLNEIYNLAKEHEDVVFIGSDLGPGTLDEFKKERPDQFFMEGISEAHIVSMAAGLSSEGQKVYINTIAPFFTRRAFEQIALDIYAENEDVVIYGNGGGLVYGPLGHSHTAVDDFASFFALSNMIVLAPADANEMKQMIQQSYKIKKPIYIRLGKGGDKVVTENKTITIGKALEFRDTKVKKKLICTTGIMLQRALEVSNEREDCDILHFSTVQPLDKDALLDNIQAYEEIIILEEHLENGGLGTRVIETLFKNQVSIKKFRHYNLGKNYLSIYGRQEEIFDHLKISPKYILEDLNSN
jgi:transketolase